MTRVLALQELTDHLDDQGPLGWGDTWSTASLWNCTGNHC